MATYTNWMSLSIHSAKMFFLTLVWPLTERSTTKWHQFDLTILILSWVYVQKYIFLTFGHQDRISWKLGQDSHLNKIALESCKRFWQRHDFCFSTTFFSNSKWPTKTHFQTRYYSNRTYKHWTLLLCFTQEIYICIIRHLVSIQSLTELFPHRVYSPVSLPSSGIKATFLAFLASI